MSHLFILAKMGHSLMAVAKYYFLVSLIHASLAMFCVYTGRLDIYALDDLMGSDLALV
jgi:hypothetical protein